MRFPSLSATPDHNFEVACYVDGVFIGYAHDSESVLQAVEQFVSERMQAIAEADATQLARQAAPDSENNDAPDRQP